MVQNDQSKSGNSKYHDYLFVLHMSSIHIGDTTARADSKITPSRGASKYLPLSLSTLPEIVLGDKARLPLRIQKFYANKSVLSLVIVSHETYNLQPFYCLQVEEFGKQWKGSKKECEFKAALLLAHQATKQEEELPAVDDLLGTKKSHTIQQRQYLVKPGYGPSLQNAEDLPSVEDVIKLMMHSVKSKSQPSSASSFVRSRRIDTDTADTPLQRNNGAASSIDSQHKDPEDRRTHSSGCGHGDPSNISSRNTLWSSRRAAPPPLRHSDCTSITEDHETLVPDELSLAPSRNTLLNQKQRMSVSSTSDSETPHVRRAVIKPRVIRDREQLDEIALAANVSVNAYNKQERKWPLKHTSHNALIDLHCVEGRRCRAISSKSLSSASLANHPSLTIPGELCLVPMKSAYFPGKIISYRRPNEYTIQAYDGRQHRFARNEFFTIYEAEFQTCPVMQQASLLGDFPLEREDPDYENSHLRRQINSYETDLTRILCGADENCWRYQKFFRSLRERRILAHYISRGPFGVNEFHFISRVLRQMFIERYNSQERVRCSHNSTDLLNPKVLQLFCDDVLLPEVIIRLIMAREKIGYGEAEQEMLHGYMDSRWVDQVMAARNSFIDGRISLAEKHSTRMNAEM
ncbi:hypothetical protein K493DRAFT_304524 [Basidiobolus meristosporus CBS 931.73]|uniref:Uncharacterized protein n=1 Tax=Basidiobolus meristosporus CBS 931.73 TaxID=1314790 RepID=A0A1Y1XYT8_9FUNG|nr:hypothetical protein K493DRAFT_304524 [Basidiobolus meristosporus CBS 931.73]|eukprot:ORX90899.1 hypothetical protein K493DRAFT_304524 [Basidiobolus meristosporus CBS 931.73]